MSDLWGYGWREGPEPTVRLASNEDYRDSHQAPGPEDGAPMHDVTQGIYPASFYDEPFRYWGSLDSPGENHSWSTIHKVRGNPDAKVRIHRALPLEHTSRERGIGLKAPLNTGDWVTPSYDYAHEHGMSRFEGKVPWTVVTTVVPASQLHTNGDSLAEWGYNGPSTHGYEGTKAEGKRKYRDRVLKKQQIDAQTAKDFHHCGFCGSPSGEPCENGCYGKRQYPGQRDVFGDVSGQQPGVSGGDEGIDYDPGALRDIRLSHTAARLAMPRLYRGLEHGFDPSYDADQSEPAGYSHWTDNPDLARQYAGPQGHVYEYDLPDEAMGQSYINDDGERPLYYDNNGQAGLNGVKGREYLVYHDHDDYDPSKIVPHTAARLAALPDGLHIQPEDDDWVAYHRGTPVGALSVDYSTEVPSIDSIRVHPDYRRRGIGKALWEAAGRPAHTPDDMSADGQAWARAVGGPRLAMPQRQKWYHVSPHDLPEGTVLKSGPGSWAGLVHFTDSPEHGRYWRENLARDEFGDNFDGQEGHLYEIEPSEKPRANSRSFDYVAPSAVVRRKVPMPPLPAEYDSPEWHAWYESTWPKRDEDEAHNQPWWPYEQPQSKKKANYMTAAVTVYTKPSCPQCDMTHKLLNRLGIEHTTVDVTADPEAHAYVTGLGYQQAPVVVVGDGEDHWGGFKVDKLKGLVE